LLAEGLLYVVLALACCMFRAFGVSAGCAADVHPTPRKNLRYLRNLWIKQQFLALICHSPHSWCWLVEFSFGLFGEFSGDRVIRRLFGQGGARGQAEFELPGIELVTDKTLHRFGPAVEHAC
jgi:hypothetical protein